MSPTPKGSAVSPQHVGTPAESTPPEIGTLVYDEASGRTGALQDILDFPEPEGPGPLRVQRLAFIRPPRGGVEFTTDPAHVRPAHDTTGAP